MWHWLRQSSLCRAGWFCQLAVQEVVNCTRNLRSMSFERKMASVVEAYLGARNVTLECFRTGRQEERIALAPDRKQRRPVCAEIFLEFGIERDIAGIIQKQVELDRIVAGP